MIAGSSIASPRTSSLSRATPAPNGSRAITRTTKRTESAASASTPKRRTASNTSGLRARNIAAASFFGRDQLHVGKIGSITPYIARKNRQARDLCMGANEEIRKNASPNASGGPISTECLARQVKSLSWSALQFHAQCTQRVLKCALATASDREFGIDHLIDEEGTLSGTTIKRFDGP